MRVCMGEEDVSASLRFGSRLRSSCCVRSVLSAAAAACTWHLMPRCMTVDELAFAKSQYFLFSRSPSSPPLAHRCCCSSSSNSGGALHMEERRSRACDSTGRVTEGNKETIIKESIAIACTATGSPGPRRQTVNA